MKRKRYPHNWTEIATAAKADAMFQCEKCGVPHDPDKSTGNVLTVHHLDHNPDNNEWWNLAALCQRCHMGIHGKSMNILDYLEMAAEPWFGVHLAGMLAWLALGRTIPKEEAMRDLDLYVIAFLSSWAPMIRDALVHLDSLTPQIRGPRVQRLSELAEGIPMILADAGEF